jgi:hypothetical protein
MRIWIRLQSHSKWWIGHRVLLCVNSEQLRFRMCKTFSESSPLTKPPTWFILPTSYRKSLVFAEFVHPSCDKELMRLYYWQRTSQFTASCKDSKIPQESWTYKTGKNLFKNSPCTVMKCWCPYKREQHFCGHILLRQLQCQWLEFSTWLDIPSSQGLSLLNVFTITSEVEASTNNYQRTNLRLPRKLRILVHAHGK